MSDASGSEGKWCMFAGRPPYLPCQSLCPVLQHSSHWEHATLWKAELAYIVQLLLAPTRPCSFAFGRARSAFFIRDASVTLSV